MSNFDPLKKSPNNLHFALMKHQQEEAFENMWNNKYITSIFSHLSKWYSHPNHTDFFDNSALKHLQYKTLI